MRKSIILVIALALLTGCKQSQYGTLVVSRVSLCSDEYPSSTYCNRYPYIVNVNGNNDITYWREKLYQIGDTLK